MTVNAIRTTPGAMSSSTHLPEEKNEASEAFSTLAIIANAQIIQQRSAPGSSSQEISDEIDLGSSANNSSRNIKPEQATPPTEESLKDSKRQELLNKNLGKLSMEEVIQGKGEDKIVRIQQEAVEQASKNAAEKTPKSSALSTGGDGSLAKAQEPSTAGSPKDFVFANKGYLNAWNADVNSSKSTLSGQSLPASTSAGALASRPVQLVQEIKSPLSQPSAPGTSSSSGVLSGATALSQVRRVGAATNTVHPEGSRFTAPVAEKVKYISTKGLDKAQIVLEPKGLGLMRVEISSTNKETSIVFKVADENAAQMLASNLSGLKQEISLAGLNLTEASIEYGQGQGFSGENFGGSDSQESPLGESLELDLNLPEQLRPESSGVKGNGRLHVVI